MRRARGGKAYDATFGRRMVGEGAYADLIVQRMRLAKARLGYATARITLNAEAFTAPGAQLALF